MFLSLLAIVRVGAVFAHVMLLNQQRVHGEVGINREGYESHLGALLHHLGIVNGIVG